MKILLINYEYPPYGGGAGNATKEIGWALARMGHSVEIWTGGKGPSRAEGGGIVVVPVGSARSKMSESRLLEMLSFVFWGIFRVIARRANVPDVVIVFFSVPCGPVATVIRKLWCVPYIVSLRGGDVPGLVPTIARVHRVLTPVRRWVCKNSIAVVSNSVSLAKLAEAADPMKVTVIPNGVDAKRYSPVCEERKVDSAIFRLLLVSRFHRQKKIPETIERLAVAKRRGLKFFVSIVGDGPERDLIEETVTRVSMTDTVQLEGWLAKDRILERYQQSDCYINLSSYEGMPNTVLEAMACALPVIVSDIPPHRELVRHEVTGYLDDCCSADSLYKFLSNLTGDRRRGVAMGQAGRRAVMATHSWAVAANDYLRLYKQFVHVY